MFVLQDEVQSFHWNKIQATLHPKLIYYKVNNVLKCDSICFISDDLLHDVSTVYHVMKLTIDHVKSNISQEQDFAMKCTWSFFATSHCKSPCDGFGGTVKRLTSIASLHRETNHKLTASAIFDFC